MKIIYTLFLLCVLNIILTSSPAVTSATEVVPGAYTSTPGTSAFLGPLANTARTYQLLIHDSLLTGFLGQNLTAISFRSVNSATTTWPATDITYSSYRIYLSESVPPSDRSLAFFANNVVGPQTQVRSGSLLIPANSYDTVGFPAPFGPEITFDTPYPYNGGHLLIEIRQAGGIPVSRSVDALSTSTSGYGSLFSACWKSGDTATFSAIQGNFSIVKISSSPAGSLKLDLRAFIEGLSDGVTMIPDTAKVYLRNDFAPYAIVDSAVAELDANGDGSFTYFNAVDGVDYYIVVDQRNSINTWSSAGVSFTAGAASYDFTFSQGSAYGNNLVFVSPVLNGLGAWTIYSGDVNKDGFIDLTDLIVTTNDASNFVTGYVVTDVNGDLEVNLLDMLLIYNNVVIFIKEERPL